VKKFALLIALLLAESLPAYAAPSTPAAVSHPIVGKWQWTRSTNNCTEIYDYRADGTIFAISGAEETTSTYKIAERPNSNGFYALTSRLVKTNGAQDCSDNPPSADTAPYTIYILLHRSQTTYMVCLTPALDRCAGPLRRMPP